MKRRSTWCAGLFLLLALPLVAHATDWWEQEGTYEKHLGEIHKIINLGVRGALQSGAIPPGCDRGQVHAAYLQYIKNTDGDPDTLWMAKLALRYVLDEKKWEAFDRKFGNGDFHLPSTTLGGLRNYINTHKLTKQEL